MKLLFFLGSLLTAFTSTAQIVTTQFGPIQGSTNGAIQQFLGIPFAKPPVGNLRWKAPENPDSWSTTLNTTSFAPVCPQKKFEQGGGNPSIVGNEDCLYLNVWTPQTTIANLPVMVFIHGGGNQQGSASEQNAGAQLYFGKNLAERGDVVVVTIQYRLGPLGFLVHPGLEQENANNTSGNYAAMDQILALKWIENNIANFGGNPNNVTIFGESAGGVNVGNLLVSPQANGLFDRAIIQSAVPVLNDYSTAITNGINYVDTFTVSGTAVQKIAYMRTLPIDSIVKYEVAPLSGGAVGMYWQSVVDNEVFFQKPFVAFQSGNFNHVPLIVGSNADEMSLSAPQTVTPTMVTLLRNSLVPVSLQANAAAIYPSGSNNSEARKSYIDLLTDAQFTATTRRLAQCVSENQTEPVFRYFFTQKHSVSILQNLGSYHGMELFYVFNTWENATLGSGPFFSAQDDSTQQIVLKYWTNFAANGQPNQSDLATWPTYNASSDCFIELKATPNGSNCGIRSAASDLWDDVINYVPCTSSLNIETLNNTYSITCFPNPNNGQFELRFPLEETYAIKQIIDASGRLIVFQQVGEKVFLNQVENGVYFVQIEHSNSVQTIRVVVNQ